MVDQGQDGDRGKAGNEHDSDRRLGSASASCEFDPIDTRHDDVGDQKIVFFVVDGALGAEAIADGIHGMPGAYECTGEKTPHRFVVFGKKYFSHERYPVLDQPPKNRMLTILALPKCKECPRRRKPQRNIFHD